MNLSESFKITQTKKGDQTIVNLVGVIDEDAHFDQLGKLSGKVTFNFRGITAINSCGVRNWVNLMKELSQAEISYEECPPVIVRQLNMVPSFAGKANVLSAFVPYVCDNCDSEKFQLVQAKEFASVAEAMPCDKCKKGEMEFDGQPKQYFAFKK